MPTGTPHGREALIGTVSALAAIILAGLASVVVQLGGAGAYVAFVILLVAIAVLVVISGRWFRRARVSS